MKVSPDKTFFTEMLTRAFPQKGEQIPMPLAANDDEEEERDR
jgi:hypothetical protein